MEYTEYYQFRKPTKAVDIVKVGDINFNSEKIDELIHSTQVSLAPDYDATRTSENPYMTGDVVMKDALMYRCLENDVYGAWDATKWERTTAGEEGAGGSSVEANPQGTPTDDLDTIGINGTIYNIARSGGGGGNVYGAFIDTNRVIQAQTAETSQATYTATEDCMVVVQCEFNHSAPLYYIDDVLVGGIYNSASYDGTLVQMIPLKKDSVLKIVPEGSGKKIMYTVYGLTFGTQNIFTPQIYSTEERCVGIWIDNKPLYCKTYQYSAPSGSGSHTLGSIPSGIKVYNCKAVARLESSNVLQPFTTADGNATAYVYINDTEVKFPVRNDNWGGYDVYVTIWYTKDSDVAGSGSYNTLGVPMEHIDNTETVIGTFFGETWYEKSFDLNGVVLTDNDWNNSILGTTGIKIQEFEGYIYLNNNTDELYPFNWYRSSTTNICAFIEGADIAVRPNMNAGTIHGRWCKIRYTKSSS